ncbi:hypothetical protein ABZY58_11850 [Micromonospora tulbaghiae]|uniref:hypothetical protein n=1 Tax=Micromonospora tulbaghiae TaxID=479978 RepID=UPI0033B734D5
MDDGERVQPWLVQGLRRLQRWRRGHEQTHAAREVTLGRMPDGRWLVEVSDVRVPSLAYRTEEDARRRVTALTASGGWTEIPAVYDASARPVGEGWQRRGGQWYRP